MVTWVKLVVETERIRQMSGIIEVEIASEFSEKMRNRSPWYAS